MTEKFTIPEGAMSHEVLRMKSEMQIDVFNKFIHSENHYIKEIEQEYPNLSTEKILEEARARRSLEAVGWISQNGRKFEKAFNELRVARPNLHEEWETDAVGVQEEIVLTLIQKMELGAGDVSYDKAA